MKKFMVVGEWHGVPFKQMYHSIVVAIKSAKALSGDSQVRNVETNEVVYDSKEKK